MACLDLSNGNFVNLVWGNAANTNAGDVTIERDASQIQIQKVNFGNTLVLNGDFRYVVYGPAGFIALLRIETFGGNSTRTVFIVDVTGSNLTAVQILQINLSNTQSLPSITHSPGSGSLTFFWTPSGNQNEVSNLRIVRSDSGFPVLSVLGAISGLTAAVSAEVTATQLIIHHPNDFGSDSTAIQRPAGSLTIDPGAIDFGEAVLNAADPSLATITRTFTLRNNGNDCIRIDGVQNNAPFSLTAASAAQFPVTIDPDETVDIDVVFAPATTGHFARMLQVDTVPAAPAAAFTCVGDARLAVAQITASTGSIAFGTIPHPGTDNRTFTVSNTGELNLTITIPAAPAGSDFVWTSVVGQALPVGGNPFQATVTFTTPGDGPATPRTITITPSDGQPRSVTLTGAGCVPNAEIQVPNIAPLAFGEIERGFRTVRFIEIRNTGDATLTFLAEIVPAADPAHADLFGLVRAGEDITDARPDRPYTVLPTQRCGTGPTGANTEIVAVGFFADGASGSRSANLRIRQHNADNFPPGQTWTFPLSADVIDPVPVDAILVLDRSGSMNDTIGARSKSEAAVSAGSLFVQMLRDSADDRAAVVRFNENPEVVQGILPVQGNRAQFEAAMTAANFAPSGATNIAGGIILGNGEFTPHPTNPPVLKKAMIVLTDGKENRCFQEGGGGPWFSITGRDSDDSPAMRRPDGMLQDSEVLPTPEGVKIYGIGLGNPAQIDAGALDALSTATGASYEGVEELTGKDFFLLEKYFTQIFMETAGLQQISDPFYTIHAGDVHEHEFDVFPGDVNAMVVVYDEPGMRLPFYIVSPKEEVLSGISLPAGFALRHRSTTTARFVEFHFPHKEPERYAGRWKVVVRHEKRVCAGDVGGGHHKDRDERRGKVGPGFLPEKCREWDQPVGYGIAIGAGSNLRMQPYVEPGEKHVGETIRLTAVLAEAGIPVKGSDVRVHVETPAGQQFQVVLRDDGQHQDGEPDDGEYAGLFHQTFTAGIYRFLFRAQGLQAGRPYVREAHRTKTVLSKREPEGVKPGDGDRPDDGGTAGGDDCCRKLLRVLRRQEEVLRRLADRIPK